MTDKSRLLTALLEDFLPFLKNAREALFSIDRARAQQLFTLLDLIQEISLIESGKISCSKDNVSLGSFLKAVSASLEFAAGQRNVKLSIDQTAAIQDFTGDQKRLKTAVITLLSSLIHHLPPQSSVKLFLSSNPHEQILLNAAFKNLKGPDFNIQRLLEQSEVVAAGALLKLLGCKLDSTNLESDEILLSVTLFTPPEQEKKTSQEEFVRFDLSLPSSKSSPMPTEQTTHHRDSTKPSLPEVQPKAIVKESDNKDEKVSRAVTTPLRPRHSEHSSKEPETGQESDEDSNKKDPADIEHDTQWALVADDSPLNLKSITQMLVESGFKVETAADGKEAYDRAFNHPYRLAIIDIEMPVLNGLKVTAMIREKETKTGRRVPIIGLCVHLSSEEEREARRVGMDIVLRKPFLKDDLIAALIELQVSAP